MQAYPEAEGRSDGGGLHIGLRLILTANTVNLETKKKIEKATYRSLKAIRWPLTAYIVMPVACSDASKKAATSPTERAKSISPPSVCMNSSNACCLGRTKNESKKPYAAKLT